MRLLNSDAVLCWEDDVHAYERINRVNYLGVIYTIRAAVPGMVQRDSGRILFVSSLMATLGMHPIEHRVFVKTTSAVCGVTKQLMEVQACRQPSRSGHISSMQ